MLEQIVVEVNVPRFKVTSRMLEQIVVEVNVPRIVTFRLMLGIWLVKLGVRITGCTVDIKKEQEEKGNG